MKISYKWLQEYIDLDISPDQLASILTSIGLEVGEVEKIESIKGGLEGLVVGEVVECLPHPNSDHLHITQTKISQDTCLQIICGASNVAVGQKVIVATVGSVLYKGEEVFQIKPCKLRGVESNGMLCAEDEIQVGDDHSGIIVLPSEVPVGMPAKEYYKVTSDTIFEIDVTPNRSDALSHYGVARDLYAYYKLHACMDATLKCPALHLPVAKELKSLSNDYPIRVTVKDKEACPRYSGVTVRGVRVGESPKWLQERLLSIGLKPINNIVDVANFVMFELGQPLHTFDADKIKGGHIIVDRAGVGERFVTLDGVERQLSVSDLMIRDEEKSLCIAGVFGGLESGISDGTVNVFIESAYFDPVSIRMTARRHGLSTDASFRYERGCDPNNTLFVLRRCAGLILETAGGQISMDSVDVVNGENRVSDERQTWFSPYTTEVRLQRLRKLIGVDIEASLLECAFDALEMRYAKDNINGEIRYKVSVPRYRTDVQRECDVIEDFLRLYGYNQVPNPSKLNTSINISQDIDVNEWQKRISEQLVACGFYEIMNNSLTRVSYYEGEGMDGCVKILNPLSSDLSVMRRTMLWGGLESISRNLRFKNTDLRFFEFGKCYDRIAEGSYKEETHLALWITGNQYAPSWLHKSEKVTFYQLHAYFKNILLRMGVDLSQLNVEPYAASNCPWLSDGLVYKSGEQSIGYLAVVSSDTLRGAEIEQEVYYADFNWDALLRLRRHYHMQVSDLPRYPYVKRDLSMVFPKTILFKDIRSEALKAEKKLLKDVYLFDVYEGKNIDADKKSYAISFILQDEAGTLTDSKIEGIMHRIQKSLENRFNAILRG